jgi:hypothetical protein
MRTSQRIRGTEMANSDYLPGHFAKHNLPTRRLCVGALVKNIAHPAQPDNLASQQAVNFLRASAATVLYVAYRMRKPQRPKVRQALKRELSGVLGDVETVRVAIRE